MDLINARSERSLAAARQVLRGALGRHMAALVAETVGALATVEAVSYTHLYALMRSTQSPNGPNNSALFIVGYLYDAAYSIGDLGLASAVGWVLALIMLTVSLIQLRLTGAGND